MTQPEILVLGPQLPSLIEALERDYKTHKLWQIENPASFLAAKGPQIKGLVTSFINGADKSLLDALPHLEIIASYGVGLDRVDLNTVRARGITLTNTPDISEPVADIAIALLLGVTRRICQADRYVRAGKWPKEAFPFGVGFGGKTCGIVGLGRIGRAVAKRAEAFGLNIAYFGPHPKPDVAYRYFNDLIVLAEAADFLVLALPGGAETDKLINQAVLSALGPTGFLINVARGSVVDEAALVHSLQAQEIAGAGLDVFEQEPLENSPLFALENVVLLPHIASATFETRHAMGEVVVENLRAHWAGQPVLTPVLV